LIGELLVDLGDVADVLNCCLDGVHFVCFVSVGGREMPLKRNRKSISIFSQMRRVLLGTKKGFFE
jgi:hypothetical protein